LFEHDLFRKPVPTFRDHALKALLGAGLASFWYLMPDQQIPEAEAQ
jgi:hypothetical protein